MTSSGTYNFNPSIGQCVLSAYERIQIRAPSIRQEHMNTARVESNLQMVTYSNLQPNRWLVELISVPMVNGTAVYIVPARVVMILDAWITVNQGQSSASDLYITPVSQTEYASFSNKNTPGRPTCFWFQKTIPTQTATMWPVPDSSGPYTLNYFACRQVQDTNLAGGETADIPYLWLDAYIAGMAHRLARVYKPELEAVRKADAKEAWDIAATQNSENVPLAIVPTLSSYYRR